MHIHCIHIYSYKVHTHTKSSKVTGRMFELLYLKEGHGNFHIAFVSMLMLKQKTAAIFYNTLKIVLQCARVSLVATNAQ